MPKAEPVEIRQAEEAGRQSGTAPDMTASAPGDIAARPDGTVTGVPRRWLRLEGAVRPAAMIGLAWWQSRPVVLALGLIWRAHIGLDRLLGYGLKYDDHFQHTHLGIQRAGRRPAHTEGTLR